MPLFPGLPEPTVCLARNHTPNVDVRTINHHLKKIYADGEMSEGATIRKFRIVHSEGDRQISRAVNHYDLQMIIAVGFKVNNERTIQFRRWANAIVKDYTIQGWVLDDERLKNGGSILTKEYFDHLLERIREIRLSERRFYQKITEQDRAQRLNRFLEFNEYDILHDSGRVTHEIAKSFAESEFEKYRVVQDRLFESDFDRFLALERSAEDVGKA